MGTFDTLKALGFKCPYCGSSTAVDFQTKDADCMMGKYYVHEPGTFKRGNERIKNCMMCDGGWGMSGKEHLAINNRQLSYVSALGSCQSPECSVIGRARDVLEGGYTSGFGRSIDVEFSIEKQHRWVSLPIRKITLDGLDGDKIWTMFQARVKIDSQLQARLQPALDRVDDLGIALLQTSVRLERKKK
jgi:hypothetical protein